MSVVVPCLQLSFVFALCLNSGKKGFYIAEKPYLLVNAKYVDEITSRRIQCFLIVRTKTMAKVIVCSCVDKK